MAKNQSFTITGSFIDLISGPFKIAIGTIRKQWEEVGRSFKSMLTLPWAAGGGVISYSIDFLSKSIAELTANMDQLGKTARRLDLSTESFSAMSYAATQAGTNIATLEIALRIFNRNVARAERMPASDVAKSFRAIGLDIARARAEGESFEKILTKTINQVNMFDRQIRADIVTLLFGEVGPRELILLENFNRYMEEAKALGITLSEQEVSPWERLAESGRRLAFIFEMVKAKVLVPFVPIIDKLVDKIGRYLSMVPNLVNELIKSFQTDGKFFVAFGASLLNVVNTVIVRGLYFLGYGLYKVLSTVVMELLPLINAFVRDSIPDWIPGLGGTGGALSDSYTKLTQARINKATAQKELIELLDKRDDAAEDGDAFDFSVLEDFVKQAEERLRTARSEENAYGRVVNSKLDLNSRGGIVAKNLADVAILLKDSGVSYLKEVGQSFDEMSALLGKEVQSRLTMPLGGGTPVKPIPWQMQLYMRQQVAYKHLYDAQSGFNEGKKQARLDRQSGLITAEGYSAIMAEWQETLRRARETAIDKPIAAAGQQMLLGELTPQEFMEIVKGYERVVESFERMALLSEDSLAGAFANLQLSMSEVIQRFSDLTEAGKEMGKVLGEALTSGIADSFVDIINGTKSVGQAFKDLARNVINDLLRIMIQMMMARMLMSMFGGFFGATSAGGVPPIAGISMPGKASGGIIGGPQGAGDIMPTMLSPGEGIVTAAAVQHYGPGLIHALNARVVPRTVGSFGIAQLPSSGPGFATGGVVSPRVPSASPAPA